MKIDIPHVVRDLSLSEYAPEMNGAVLKVWVNPTRDCMARFDPALSDDAKLSAWYSELLSQSADTETHLSADELLQVYEADPALWSFIAARAWQLIGEHRAALEKKQVTPSATA